MSLSVRDQAKDVLGRAEDILIIPAEDLSGDSVGSAFALGKALEESGKNASVMLPKDVSPRLSFLPQPKNILRAPKAEREFALKLDTREVPVEDLRYEKDGDFLKIYITTPARLSRDHVALEGGGHEHDLIVSVGAPDFESLGEVFTSHPSLFLDVPILNIDHRAANERYGKINLVDLAASTTAEIVAEFLEYWNASLIDAEVATLLLAGILEGTKSFQGLVVSSKTLTLAATLISRGARREEIVQHLYKTREIGYLKLWGRIMTRLEFAEAEDVAYAGITQEDFVASQARAEALPSILEDLRTNFGSFSTIALYWLELAPENRVQCIAATNNEGVRARFEKIRGARRHGGAFEFPLASTRLEEAESEILQLFSPIAGPLR